MTHFAYCVLCVVCQAGCGGDTLPIYKLPSITQITLSAIRRPTQEELSSISEAPRERSGTYTQTAGQFELATYLDLASQNQSKNAPGTGQGLRVGSHVGSRTSHRDEGRDEKYSFKRSDRACGYCR